MNPAQSTDPTLARLTALVKAFPIDFPRCELDETAVAMSCRGLLPDIPLMFRMNDSVVVFELEFLEPPL